MAGISIVLDLLRKKPCISGHCVNSYSLFSATTAAAAAASSVGFAAPFATWAFCSKDNPHVAYCDAGEALTVDYSSAIADLSGRIFQQNALYDGSKDYNIALKPIFSAFYLKNFAFTSLRSFLLFYLPLLEPRAIMDEDADDLLPDTSEDQLPDLVAPFKKSVKQIARDSSVVTTRRVLERLAVHYVSQRMACKLLKDAPKSAIRKAGRGMSPLKYTCSVSRTTFRAHFLGILASWVVQVGIDVYRFFRRVFSSDKKADETETVEQLQQLGRKIYATSVRCGASLVFASIGAGIGAVVIRPSTGQWIGCAIGDLAGPVIVSYCFDKLLHIDL